MALHLEEIKGPVGDEELKSIAATYGRHNRRFTSADFCRTVFNENPYGYSYHTFVYDDDRVIGHYALVPMRVTRGDRRVDSGWGEALFLDDAYRNSKVEFGGKRVPCAMALMDSVWSQAAADGVELIQVITNDRIGMVLERLRRFGSVPIHRAEYRCRVSLPPGSGDRESGWRTSPRLLARRAVLLTQWMRRRLLGGLLALVRAPKVRVDAPEHLDEQLAAIANADPDDRAPWRVSRDVDVLRWQRALGRLEIHAPEGAPERFAAVVRQMSPQLVPAFKLLRWNVGPGDWRAGLAVLNSVLRRAEEQSATHLSVDRATLLAHDGVLRSGIKLVGSNLMTDERKLYIKSEDRSAFTADALPDDCLLAM